MIVFERVVPSTCLAQFSLNNVRTGDLLIWFIECFTTTLLHTHHSLLAKLGRWGWLRRMRLAWKKSQKTLNTSKGLHQNKNRSTGNVGKGILSQLLPLSGTADSETGRVVIPWRVLRGGRVITGGSWEWAGSSLEGPGRGQGHHWRVLGMGRVITGGSWEGAGSSLEGPGRGQGHHWRVLRGGRVITEGSWEGAGSSLEGPGRRWNPYPRSPRDCWWYGDPSRRTPVLLRIIYNGPPYRAPPSRLLRHSGWGMSIIAQTLQRYPFTRPPSRSRVYLIITYAPEESFSNAPRSLL